MDLMSIIGFVLGNLLVLFGMVFNQETMSVQFGNIGYFIDYPSIAITVGGTIASLMIAHSISSFKKIPKHLKIVFKPTVYDPFNYIDQIVEFAKEARTKGLLSLEDKLNETEDAFLKHSLMLVVDSVEPEKVKTLLETELDYMDDRHAQDRSFYEKGGSFGPAFGMIGTLVGLILMLQDMSDPSAIGGAMAVALLTTLYGSMIANMFFIPIANKLKIRHEEEYLCKMIICEGVQAIQAGENPKFLAEKLTLLLPATMSGSKDKGDGGGEGEDGGGKKKGKK